MSCKVSHADFKQRKNGWFGPVFLTHVANLRLRGPVVGAAPNNTAASRRYKAISTEFFFGDSKFEGAGPLQDVWEHQRYYP